MTKLTSAEKEALAKIKREKWGSAVDLEKDDFELDLAAPIKKVERVIAKALKPGRTLLSAVRFSGGGVIEEFAANGGDDGEPVAPAILGAGGGSDRRYRSGPHDRMPDA